LSYSKRNISQKNYGHTRGRIPEPLRVARGICPDVPCGGGRGGGGGWGGGGVGGGGGVFVCGGGGRGRGGGEGGGCVGSWLGAPLPVEIAGWVRELISLAPARIEHGAGSSLPGQVGKDAWVPIPFPKISRPSSQKIPGASLGGGFGGIIGSSAGSSGKPVTKKKPTQPSPERGGARAGPSELTHMVLIWSYRGIKLEKKGW